MGDATINGETPQSATLSHINSYPVVTNTVKTYKSNPYGRKSIDLTNAAYGKFVKPTLPYFETPASYVKPYAAKADELGDKFLTRFDEKVPIVKSETEEIKSTVIAYAQWPLGKATETKDWVFGTYNQEYKKCGGNGVVAGGKAFITTGLVLTSETLSWLSEILAAKKSEAQDLASQAKEKAGAKADSLNKTANAKASELNEKTKQATK